MGVGLRPITVDISLFYNGWMTELPDSLINLFESAGWHPGRLVPIPPSVNKSHPAASLLGEFNALTVGDNESGKDCARSDISFKFFTDENEQVDELACLLGSEFIGVAKAQRGYLEIYVDEKGRTFTTTPVVEGVMLAGYNFAEAAERLLFGCKLFPLLLPSQDTVPYYGETLRRGDPRILPLGGV